MAPYNTHWVASLCLVPILGYTGAIPLLNHRQNGPHPQTLVPTVSLKTGFPRIPTYPSGYPQHLLGRTPVLRLSLWQRSDATHPQNTYSGSHRDTFAQGLPKNDFSLGTHQTGRVPTWSLYNTHGVAPLCFDLGSYPCSTIVRMTPALRLLYPQSL